MRALLSVAALLWTGATFGLPGSQEVFKIPKSNGDAILTPELDATISDILKEFKTPGGVGVAVVRKNRDGTWHLESKGYGNATVNGDEVTAETLFAIGSNSKLFDVLATGLLISNETLNPRVSWTSKIASLIPEWKLMDPVASSESTIVDLMSHRTGLPRHDFMAPLNAYTTDIIPRLRYLRPSTGFREQLQYNNHMYTVLSHLPRALINVQYEDFVRDNILVPLGMNSSMFFYADAVKTGHLADSFIRENPNISQDPFAQGTIRAIPFWDRSPTGHVISGAGGIISSSRDMAVWLQTLLMEGKNQQNETVIPAEVIRKVATGVTIYNPVASFPELSPVVYGGGQMRGTYRGYEKIEHGGATNGFRTQITRFPSENFGVAVLSNEDDLGNSIVESVKNRIVDEVFGLEPIDWVSRYRQRRTKEVAPPAIPRSKNAEAPAVPYAELAGTYINPAYGTLDFCLFFENKTTGSACGTLAKIIPEQLPGVIDPEVPTLLARWDTMGSTHLRLAHYSGDVFNLTALESYPTLQGPEKYWVRKIEGLRAEFEVKGGNIGFAPIDVWGPGDDVSSPEGSTVEERAEVWFAKTQ